jgi:hypothetical protein
LVTGDMETRACKGTIVRRHAGVAELVDALDLGSSA